MSQYYKHTPDGKYTVQYGWDNPLQSYFYTVYDKQIEEEQQEQSRRSCENPDTFDEEWDERNTIVADSGLGGKRIWDIDVIMIGLGSWITLTPKELEKLKEDRTFGR